MSSGVYQYPIHSGTDIEGSGEGTTATFTPGSPLVEGQFTVWNSALMPGDLIFAGGQVGVVKSIEGPENLTLAYPWTGPAITAGPYVAQRWMQHTDGRWIGVKITEYFSSVQVAPAVLEEAQRIRVENEALANEAREAATDAAGSASEAGTERAAAEAAASTANTRANDATEQAGLAKSWATKLGDEVVAGEGFSARQYAQNASGSADAAAQSASDAAGSAGASQTAREGSEAARDKAEQWSSADPNTEVEPGKYSAYHWAEQAKSFAEGDASNISVTPAGGITATNVQSALEELDTKKAPLDSAALTGTPTAPTAEQSSPTVLQIANLQFVRDAIAALVGSSPATLDTLNELAAALGDDPNFATTVTNALAGKVNKSGDTISGNLGIRGTLIVDNATSGSPGLYVRDGAGINRAAYVLARSTGYPAIYRYNTAGAIEGIAQLRGAGADDWFVNGNKSWNAGNLNVSSLGKTIVEATAESAVRKALKQGRRILQTGMGSIASAAATTSNTQWGAYASSGVSIAPKEPDSQVYFFFEGVGYVDIGSNTSGDGGGITGLFYYNGTEYVILTSPEQTLLATNITITGMALRSSHVHFGIFGPEFRRSDNGQWFFRPRMYAVYAGNSFSLESQRYVFIEMSAED